MVYHSVLICCGVGTERTCIKLSVCRYWGRGFSYSKRQFLSLSAGSDFVKKMYKRLVFPNIIKPINIFKLFFPKFLRADRQRRGESNRNGGLGLKFNPTKATYKCARINSYETRLHTAHAILLQFFQGQGSLYVCFVIHFLYSKEFF